jgi:hypothetical protein
MNPIKDFSYTPDAACGNLFSANPDPGYFNAAKLHANAFMKSVNQLDHE